MAEVHVLRHLVLAQGKSQHEVAKTLGISRNTVARYLKEDVAVGAHNEPMRRPKPVYQAIVAKVFEIMKTARTTKKQRLTSPVMQRLSKAEGLIASRRSIRRTMSEYRRLSKESASTSGSSRIFLTRLSGRKRGSGGQTRIARRVGLRRGHVPRRSPSTRSPRSRQILAHDRVGRDHGTGLLPR